MRRADLVLAALERLRHAADSGALAGWCETHAVQVLVVFGSAVDPVRASSALDLDIAVLLDEGADLVSVMDQLAGWLEFGDVDVLDLGRAGPVAREQALVGTEPLYEASRGLWARLQMAAMLERMDTAWLRRLDLELMAGPG